MTAIDETENRGQMLVIFREVAEGLVHLDTEDRHRIMDAVLDWYAGGAGEGEKLSPTASLIATMIREKQLAYAAVCRVRSQAGTKSGEARRRTNSVQTNSVRTGVRTKSNSTSTSTSTSTSMSMSTSGSNDTHKCAHPTIDEVRDYCRERGNRVDAQAWYDYYTANGWRVGRNAMKNWQAAVRTWERNGVGAAKAKSAHGDNYIGATEAQGKEFSDGFAA